MSLSTEALKLANHLHDTSGEMVAMCKQWLNDSMFLILARKGHWSFLEASGTLTTVADQQTYSMATDFGVTDLRRIYSMQREDGTHLDFKTIEYIDRRSIQTGTPQVAATWNGDLYMFPTPATVELYTWRGYLRQSPLGDADSPPWEGEFDAIWRIGAEAMGLEYLSMNTAAQKWALFNYNLSSMFGDSEQEDEEIEIEPWSLRGRTGIFVDDTNTAWP